MNEEPTAHWAVRLAPEKYLAGISDKNVIVAETLGSFQIFQTCGQADEIVEILKNSYPTVEAIPVLVSVDRSPLEKLEKWLSENPSRYANMSVGTHLAATCWGITLGNVSVKFPEDGNYFYHEPYIKKSATVHVEETSFFERDEELEKNVFFVDEDLKDGWPGLAKTIEFAIEKANELGL